MEKSIQEGQGVPLKDESSSRSRLEDDKPSLVTAQIELSEDSSTKKDKDDEVEDYEPAIQFSPLIPLPPLVDVGKIHEMEDIIFKARGKIYCFDPYGKHWNERGIGDIKILQDKEVKSKVRVVMWRENVNTVACNHLVKTVNAIREQNMSKNTIIWSALDFAFEYPHEEIFACKFTTLEDVSAQYFLFSSLFLVNSFLSFPFPFSVPNSSVKWSTFSHFYLRWIQALNLSLLSSNHSLSCSKQLERNGLAVHSQFRIQPAHRHVKAAMKGRSPQRRSLKH